MTTISGQNIPKFLILEKGFVSKEKMTRMIKIKKDLNRRASGVDWMELMKVNFLTKERKENIYNIYGGTGRVIV